MEDQKITYKDFKIGQRITCVKIDDTVDRHLTVGKIYKIRDLDFHFPDSICVKTDSKITMFIKIQYFLDIQFVRNLKLNKLNSL